MIIKTTGIVLHQVKYSESSLILDVFTPDYGRLNLIIGGVRKANAKVSASMLRPAMLIDLVAYHKDPVKLQRIKEVSPHVNYRSIPFDVVRGNTALFLVEVIRQILQSHGSDEALFNLAYENLIKLDTAAGIPDTFLHLFIIELAEISGLGIQPPDNEADLYFNLQTSGFAPEQDVLHGMEQSESRMLMNLLKKNAIQKSTKAAFSPENEHFSRSVRRALLDGLIRYVQWHQPGFKDLKTIQVLRDLTDSR